MPRQNRGTQIDRRQRRHHKLAKLRKRYAAARTDPERNALMAKAKRVSPWVTAEGFTKALAAGKPADKAGRSAKS